MTESNDNRIDILEGILLKLHHGAEPDSVQEEFNEHFTGVSAIEISMMEHQLIYGDSVITFQDVLKLCNVHANLFKGSIEDGEIHEADQPGHPVTVFKEENMALRSALLRINNILNTFEAMPSEELTEGMIKGLKRQYDIIGQFDNHYKRKEHLFFPVMEKYGHDAPPKVMWAKDDEIRDLFKRAYKAMEKFPNIKFEKMKERFEDFQFEFNEMIFKEEAILINILLEALDTMDWYRIAEQSDNYGYAIIRPQETWVPDNLDELVTQEIPDTAKIVSQESLNKPVKTIQVTQPSDDSDIVETRKVSLGNGKLTIIWEPDGQSQTSDTMIMNPTVPIPIGDGFLSLEQIKVIFDYIPAKVTFVDSNNIVQYFNHNKDDKLFSRSSKHIGSHVRSIFAPTVWDKLEPIIEQLNTGQIKEEAYWFKRGNEFLHIQYKALYNEADEYVGFVEIIQNIQPILDIETEKWRNLLPPSKVDKSLKKTADLTRINQNNLVSTQTKHIQFADDILSLSWLNSAVNLIDDPSQFDYKQLINIGDGYLSLNQIKLIFNALPFEITYVDDNHVFQYFNTTGPYDEMLFQRSPLEVGRNLEYCHPARVWPKVKRLSEDLRDQNRFVEPMWFSPMGKLIYILYIGTQDQDDNYRGIVETVQDASPYLEMAKSEKPLF